MATGRGINQRIGQLYSEFNLIPHVPETNSGDDARSQSNGYNVTLYSGSSDTQESFNDNSNIEVLSEPLYYQNQNIIISAALTEGPLENNPTIYSINVNERDSLSLDGGLSESYSLTNSYQGYDEESSMLSSPNVMELVPPHLVSPSLYSSDNSSSNSLSEEMTSGPYDQLLAPGVLGGHFSSNTNMAQPTLPNDIFEPGPPPLELSEEDRSLNDSCESSTLVDSDSSTDMNVMNEISNGVIVGIDAAVVCSKVDSRSNSLNEVSQSDVDKIETDLLEVYNEVEAPSNSQEPLNQESNISNLNPLQAQDIVPNINEQAELVFEQRIYNKDPVESTPQVQVKQVAKNICNQTFKPKVAGRKKIDMKARRYIIDNEEDDKEIDVDIETVTREDNPLIVANDVNSLLDQFEANVEEVSVSKDKKPEKPALSRIQREKEEKRKRLEVLKEKLKNIRARNNASKKDESKARKSKINRDPTWKPNRRSNNYKSKETKSSSKKDERRYSSKSLSPPLKDSRTKAAEEQKKSPSPRPSSQQKPTENGKRKSAERHQPEKSPKIGENAMSTVKPSPPTEVPKELIGRIKEGIKPRTIKLLDDDSIFNQMFTDNHKKRTTTKKPTKSGANTTSNSKLSPKSMASSTSPNCTYTSSKSGTVGTSTSYSIQSGSGSSKPFTQSVASFSGNSNSILSRGSVPAKPLMKSVASGSSYPSRVPTQYAPVGNSTNLNQSGTKPVNGTSTSRAPSTYVPAATSNSSVQFKPYPSRPGNNPIVIPMRSMPGVAQAISKTAGTSMGSRHCSNVVVPHAASSRLTSNGSLASKIPPSFAGRNGVNPSVPNGVKKQEEMNATRFAINLDHCYHQSVFQRNKIETLNKPRSENVVRNGINGINFNNQNSKQNAEQPASKPIKRVSYEEYKKKHSLEARRSPNQIKASTGEDWAKKILDAPPPVPEGLIRVDTHDIGIDACLIENRTLDNLASLERVQKGSNGKIDEHSLLTSYKEGIKNKPDGPVTEFTYLHENHKIGYVRKDEVVKPKMCDASVQTDLSLVVKQSKTLVKKRRRSPSICSVSSSDSSRSGSSSSSSSSSDSDNSDDSRYTRTKKTRTGSAKYRSSNVYASSTSSVVVYNPNMEFSQTFRSMEEHDEFKRDALNRRILFLGGIPDDVDERYLVRMFERYGEIKLIKIYHRMEEYMRPDHMPQSRDFAFVTYRQSSGVVDALSSYKKDYPYGPNFQMSFGGRREFCREKYKDLDYQPLYFDAEWLSDNNKETKQDKQFDKKNETPGVGEEHEEGMIEEKEKEDPYKRMLAEYKERREYLATKSRQPSEQRSTRPTYRRR